MEPSDVLMLAQPPDTLLSDIGRAWTSRTGPGFQDTFLGVFGAVGESTFHPIGGRSEILITNLCLVLLACHRRSLKQGSEAVP